MNQPAATTSLRDSMPETASFVDRMRKEWGAPHVNRCIREAKAGKPGFFYAMERGTVTGTPFPPGSEILEWQAKAVLWGTTFAAFMATPEALDGAH